MTDKVIADNLA
jgi:Zn-dependent oligopeptidase